MKTHYYLWFMLLLGTGLSAGHPATMAAHPPGLPDVQNTIMQEERVLAFPGAMGFGAYAAGGRGGEVIAVTNLNDSGFGSLRAALKKQGPRTIVFHVSGIIDLQTRMKIVEPYVTVAGQTAPGDGITLRGAGLEIGGHDVILQHLRIRPGADVDNPENNDAIYIRQDARRVIIDHVSVSWATDENISIYGKDITIQNSIISEGLSHAGHPEEEHSKGVLVTYTADRVSLLRNLLAHNHDRNPYAKLGEVEIINNVIYNAGGTAIRLASVDGPIYVNVTGNYLKTGPNTVTNSGDSIRISYEGSPISVYVRDNLNRHRQYTPMLEALVIRERERYAYRPTPFHFETPTGILSATEAFDYVLANAGATLPRRDSVDARIVAETQSGKPFMGTQGRIIDNPEDIGGWPQMHSLPTPLDSDGDGIPDDYELANGLDPLNAADRLIVVEGYTLLEHYLNGIGGTATSTVAAGS